MKTVQKLEWLNSRAPPTENLVEFNKRRKQQNVVVPSDSNRTNTTVSVVAHQVCSNTKNILSECKYCPIILRLTATWLVRTSFLFFFDFVFFFFHQTILIRCTMSVLEEITDVSLFSNNRSSYLHKIAGPLTCEKAA